MRSVPLSSANGNTLGYDWAPPAFRRGAELCVGGVIAPSDGFAPVPRSILDGTLPDGLPMGAHGDWICQQDWDFLVYAYSNGKAESFAGPDAMKERCGIGSYDYYLIGPEQVEAIRCGLWDRLIGAGLAVGAGREKYGCTVFTLLIPPQVSPRGLRPTSVRATVANMEAEGESYIQIPATVFLDYVWKQIRTHELRRVLAAMYVFNDLPRFGGVDAEELRLVDDHILISDAFMRACAQDDEVRVACCIDFLSSRCGLANWVPANMTSASSRPGEHRWVYVADDDEGSIAVLRPTLQLSTKWEEWHARQGEAQ